MVASLSDGNGEVVVSRRGGGGDGVSADCGTGLFIQVAGVQSDREGEASVASQSVTVGLRGCW